MFRRRSCTCPRRPAWPRLPARRSTTGSWWCAGTWASPALRWPTTPSRCAQRAEQAQHGLQQTGAARRVLGHGPHRRNDAVQVCTAGRAGRAGPPIGCDQSDGAWWCAGTWASPALRRPTTPSRCARGRLHSRQSMAGHKAAAAPVKVRWGSDLVSTGAGRCGALGGKPFPMRACLARPRLTHLS